MEKQIACICYHPLFVFNQFGDLERSALRPGNVHSAHGWRDVLEPVVTLGVARVHGRLHENLQLTGKLVGDLGPRYVTNQLIISPEYLKLRQKLVGALREYPEAAQAVAGVLREIESPEALDAAS